ncbi:MAG: hypothetical protein IKM67_02030 [Clostridia bacterium]|nr:hypothetical protein [Clostridia bacterium]
MVSLADGTVWGVDEDNNEGFTLRSSKPAIKLSVSPGAAIVFSGNDTYKGLSNVVDAYSEQRAMGGWILQGNGDLWVWDRDGVTVYDPVKIAENIAQYFQDQKVAITKTGELVYINYQAQEGKLDSLEITKLIDNVKTYSQGLAIDNNNMVWRINGGKAAKMLSHGKTIANENYVITQHNELWYIPYSGYPRMISENTSEYYGGEHNVILNTKGALTYTAEEKTQLIAENVARVFASSTFIDKTGRLYRYDFKSKEKTLIDINVVHYESGYYIRSDATLWKICYEDDELCSKQILDNVLMPGQTPVQPENPATPSEPSAAIDRYPDWNADDYQGVLKAMESRNPQFLTTAADGKVYGIWETWKGSYYEWTANFLEDYYTPLKFLDGAQLDINGDLYATNTMDAQYTKLFADVIDAAAEGDKGWALLSKGELWHRNAVVEDEKVAYKTSLIKTNVAKASAYSYTDLSGDSFSYTIEYGQDGTPYLANEKKLNKAQEDLSPEKPILQSCKYVFESIGETTFSYIDLEHNLYIVKDGIHKLLAEDVVYAAVWGEVCAFVKADGTLWIDNQKILDNVLLTDFTVNAASFREEMTALKQSKALLHGPHTVLIKGLSIPVILEVQDGGYVMAISARGQRIEFKVSNRKSLTDVFEVKDILVLSDGKAVGGYYIAIYPDGYTEIKNTNHVDDVSYSLYQEDGKLRYRCIVNRLSESRTFDSVAIIFDKDEVYSQEGTAIIENGKIEFLAPEKTIKACDKINVQRQFERNRKTEDTTIEQWYEENKIIYDRYFDKENERYVDEEKTASFLNNDKEIVGAGSFIGPYRQRLFYYDEPCVIRCFLKQSGRRRDK